MTIFADLIHLNTDRVTDLASAGIDRQMLSAIESKTVRKDNVGKVTNIYIHGDMKDSNIVAGGHDTVENS